MIQVEDVLDFLREKEFEEGELRTLLTDMLRQNMEFAANRAIRQFNEARQKFRDKRAQRILRELQEELIPELNKERESIKHDRAQNMYKKNRAAKKQLQDDKGRIL